MRLLFISNVYPPEVAPLANRLSEHARYWVEEEGSVEVITDVPNYPEGIVYDGYKNKFSQEDIAGVKVTRVPYYIAENCGILKRTLSYISFMLSVIWYSRRIESQPEIVVASSPQFFSAVAGYVVSRMRRIPFVFEVRDLWPEAIVAVGAMERNWIVRFFERIELFLYRKAEHIVALTDAFKRFIEAKGIDPEKISVLKNGVDLDRMAVQLDTDILEDIRQTHGLGGKFVVTYLGTIGMAHRADILLEAAQQCTDPDVVFVVVGSGADRDKLAQRQAELQVPNFRLIDKQPRHLVPYFLTLSDVSVVHLMASPLFHTVIPSKIFEAMAFRKPIVLGVEGETKVILDEAQAGIAFPPENVSALLDAVMRLRHDSALRERMGASGYAHARRYYDRSKLARRYWQLLQDIVATQNKKPKAAQAVGQP